jgi:NAD-dependent SIR2 family protein deacetylase
VMGFVKSQVIPFTKRIPRCPKCGGKCKRRYLDLDRYWKCPDRYRDFLIGEDVLECQCNECGYQFPQWTKERKEEKDGESK